MKALAFVLCLACAAPVFAQATDPAAALSQAVKSNATYEELYQRYLVAARITDASPGASIAWMTGMTADRRARRVNDIVTVRVIESISAAGSADSNLTKSTAASAAVPNLLGLETKLPSMIDPTKLANIAADSKFSGAGATTRTGDLTAIMTVRVSEVLANGDLVLEGAREIAINGDRQMIVLTGVVRPSDILPNNTVLSSQVGQLSIRYFGNGLIKDSLKPGFLVRMLNKIF
jgi:flagellar L-ring protein FlgH